MLTDGTGRSLSYLRVSVTDRCNLRCGYCMPPEGVSSLPHSEILSYGEIRRIVAIMGGLGVRRVRLTGGEPLVRRGLPGLAAQLKALPGVEFLGLTTNATLLAPQAQALYGAGVDGINISLDTTDPARYALLTLRDEWPAAWQGLQAALALPFKSIRLNCVLAPAVLESDWLGVVALTEKLPVDVRLIEWMPMGGEASAAAPPVTADAALAAIARTFGPLSPDGCTPGAGPARYYRLAGFAGRVGIIPAISHSFCAGCNRLRLTPQGDLRLCLFYDDGLALKPLLRGGAADNDISEAIIHAVQSKPAHHSGRRRAGGGTHSPGGMYGIGG